MEKKIGVITINDFNNYGNRLQCYAVQHYLEGMGYIVENIYNEYSSNSLIVNKGKRFIRQLIDYTNRKKIGIRKNNFCEFNKWIKFSKERIINGKFNENLNKKYDFFITGSDQVWNPYDKGRSGIDFLNFASDGKKISFSASMGVEKLPDHVKEKYKQYLENYKSISVREETAKKIVEDLTNRKDIEVLVDPTMLLTAEDWGKISQKPNIDYHSKYILTYFLGGDQEKVNVINSIAKKFSCEIIDVYDKNSIFYTCGPQHFLDLEKNAFLVCTDSFHSVVFAFLFNRPFIVFDRENTNINMNSRIETFLSKFGLQQSRYYANRNLDDYLNWDYSEGYKILVKEREKVRQFLVHALS